MPKDSCPECGIGRIDKGECTLCHFKTTGKTVAEKNEELETNCPWHSYQDGMCNVSGELCDLSSCAPYYFMKANK